MILWISTGGCRQCEKTSCNCGYAYHSSVTQMSIYDFSQLRCMFGVAFESIANSYSIILPFRRKTGAMTNTIGLRCYLINVNKRGSTVPFDKNSEELKITFSNLLKKFIEKIQHL